MAKCKRCSRRGLFLKLNRDGLCMQCVQVVQKEADAALQRVVKRVQEPVAATLGEKISDALRKELAIDNLGEKLLQEILTFGRDDRLPAEAKEPAALLAYRSLTSGERPESLSQELLMAFPTMDPDLSLSVMRTKCAIASSARVKFRSAKTGLTWYVWRTARDGDRVRASHRLMEGVLCNWNDPPNPQKLLDGSAGQMEHPGYAQECRCIALPVLSAEDVKLPARLHIHGTIRTITDRDELSSLIQY